MTVFNHLTTQQLLMAQVVMVQLTLNLHLMVTIASQNVMVPTLTVYNHSNTTATHQPQGVNVYSFALKPEDHQPSGTCNMSRIDNTSLKLTNDSANSKTSIYAVNYNVLRVMGGMGGLAYSN